MTLTGGDDNGEFSRKVFLNGVGGDEEGGGPNDYETVEAFSYPAREGIKVDLPPYGVVYLMVEKPGAFRYISSIVEDDPGVIHLQLSDDVQDIAVKADLPFFLRMGQRCQSQGWKGIRWQCIS